MQKFVPFYTPIWKFSSSMNMEFDVKKCLEIEHKKNGVYISNKGGYQSQGFFKDEFKNKFGEIYNFIVGSLVEVEQDTKSKYELRYAWVNVNRKHDYNASHIHSQSSISGCVYLKTNKDSGRIVFENPTPSKHYNLDDQIEGFFGTYWFLPEIGDLIMFPSYLSHHVEPNNSETERISIAFNCAKI